MRLERSFPVLARLSCLECQTYQIDYDWKTHRGSGARKKHGPNRLHDSLRPKGTSPPCHRCPKGSPEREHEFVLNERNWKAYQFALQVRATNGACLTPEAARDRILMQNLADIFEIIDDADRQDAAERIASEMACLGLVRITR